MARERTVVRGIVLRAADTKESDKILTVLTEAGKLTVLAKGARSRRSRVTACTQLLAYSELTLSESRGWQYLSEGNTVELFEAVRRDIELFSLASYFAELTEASALEDVESGAILSLLLNALYALGNLKKPPLQVKAAFEEAGFHETHLLHSEALYMPADSPLVSKLMKVYTEYTGRHDAPKCIGGGTYAKSVPNILAFGPIFPGDEVREHKPDEFMELSRLMDNTKVLASAICELAQ